MNYGSDLKKTLDYALYAMMALGLIIGNVSGYFIRKALGEQPPVTSAATPAPFVWNVPTQALSVPARTSMTCTYVVTRRNASGGRDTSNTNAVIDNQSDAAVTVQVPVGATCISRSIP